MIYIIEYQYFKIDLSFGLDSLILRLSRFYIYEIYNV